MGDQVRDHTPLAFDAVSKYYHDQHRDNGILYATRGYAGWKVTYIRLKEGATFGERFQHELSRIGYAIRAIFNKNEVVGRKDIRRVIELQVSQEVHAPEVAAACKTVALVLTLPKDQLRELQIKDGELSDWLSGTTKEIDNNKDLSDVGRLEALAKVQLSLGERIFEAKFEKSQDGTIDEKKPVLLSESVQHRCITQMRNSVVDSASKVYLSIHDEIQKTLNNSELLIEQKKTKIEEQLQLLDHLEKVITHEQPKTTEQEKIDNILQPDLLRQKLKDKVERDPSLWTPSGIKYCTREDVAKLIACEEAIQQIPKKSEEIMKSDLLIEQKLVQIKNLVQSSKPVIDEAKKDFDGVRVLRQDLDHRIAQSLGAVWSQLVPGVESIIKNATAERITALREVISAIEDWKNIPTTGPGSEARGKVQLICDVMEEVNKEKEEISQIATNNNLTKQERFSSIENLERNFNVYREYWNVSTDFTSLHGVVEAHAELLKSRRGLIEEASWKQNRIEGGILLNELKEKFNEEAVEPGQRVRVTLGFSEPADETKDPYQFRIIEDKDNIPGNTFEKGKKSIYTLEADVYREDGVYYIEFEEVNNCWCPESEDGERGKGRLGSGKQRVHELCREKLCGIPAQSS